MLGYLWTTLRPYVLGVVLGAIIATVAMLLWNRTPSVTVNAAATPQPATAKAVAALQSTVQALIDADRTRPPSAVPLTARPAVNIVQHVLPGLSAGQIAALLSASRAPTVTTISATSKLVAPSPSPIPSASAPVTISDVYVADKAAVESVLSDPNTKIATTLTIKQEEVPTSRIGTSFAPDGSGITYAVLRKNLVDLDLGMVARGTHVSPTLGVAWRIPHTSLSFGPRILYDHGLRPGIQAIVQFGPQP